MYGSKYYGSNYYASGYYGGESAPVEEEVVDLGFAGGGGISGKRRRLLKQIAEEDEIVMAFISAFFSVVVN